jgi:chitodextrinase
MGVSPSTTYSYQVSAIDENANESAKSASVNVTTDFAPPPTNKTGDINRDNVVDRKDLAILIINYGKTGTEGDLDGDNKVTYRDLGLLIANYGK